jgi:hypothetical protein
MLESANLGLNEEYKRINPKLQAHNQSKITHVSDLLAVNLNNLPEFYFLIFFQILNNLLSN